MELVPLLFFIALFFNIRASFKLALDWRGMLITTRFVREAYARLGELPTEERLERESAAPVFLHLVPAFQEPQIAVTVSALVASRYPHGRLHVVVTAVIGRERPVEKRRQRRRDQDVDVVHQRLRNSGR